jgi:hypothetical protein
VSRTYRLSAAAQVQPCGREPFAGLLDPTDQILDGKFTQDPPGLTGFPQVATDHTAVRLVHLGDRLAR